MNQKTLNIASRQYKFSVQHVILQAESPHSSASSTPQRQSCFQVTNYKFMDNLVLRAGSSKISLHVLMSIVLNTSFHTFSHKFLSSKVQLCVEYVKQPPDRAKAERGRDEYLVGGKFGCRRRKSRENGKCECVWLAPQIFYRNPGVRGFDPGRQSWDYFLMRFSRGRGRSCRR